MAWRFKASKYKNAAPIVPKPELYVRDICVGSYQTYGNNITASAKFMAFNWDHVGSSLAVLPLDDCGRKSKLMPLLHAHSDTVTDMDFSPFHDGLLATGSQDCLVKIWHIPPEGLTESLSNAECTFSHKQRRVETVGFHPAADFLLHSTSYTTLTLWDLISEKEIFSNSDHDEVVQSLSWKGDGTMLVTSCKDKQLRIFDPRSQTPCVKQANSHQSIKDSRCVWLGTRDKILSTGFDAQRLRQVIIRDLRMFNEPEKVLELDCSTGILMPLYDADTGMLFLAGKGDSTIGYMEVTDREPYLIEGIRHSGEQTKGACLVPKRALNVMQGEVNRILQLTSSSVIPVTYQVPRKTYRDFHVDLFPETAGYQTELTAQSWMEGADIPVPTITLDPAKREKGEEPIVVHRGPLSQLKEEFNSKSAKQPPKPTKPAVKPEEPHPVRSIVKKIDNKNFENDEKTVEPEEEQKPVIETKPQYVSKIVADTKEFLELEGKQNLKEVKCEEKSNVGDDGDKSCDLDSQKVPPKPLPRMSRTGSVSEPAEEGPRPVARPRHNSCTPVVTSVNPNNVVGGYKPRLGPKPFTPPKLNDTENAFSKVFSVPAVPGSNATNGIGHEKQSVEEETVSTVLVDKTPSPVTPEHKPTNENIENGANLQVEEDSDYLPQTPSTADRRKLFEVRQSSKEKEEQDRDSMDGNTFERASAQRNSIAERRRLYESQGQDNNSEKISSPVMLRRRDSFKNQKNTEESTKEENNKKNTLLAKQQSLVESRKSESIAPPQSKRTSTVFGRVSKFRHLKGTTAHKSFHIENIRNLSRQIPGECDGFHANPERVAVPQSGAGGKIAIFELSKTGRLPDGVVPTLVHGCNIMDFSWDPFDNHRLAVACDDGLIKIWKIPNGGLTEPTNEPEKEFVGHQDKINFIKFHPSAKDVLASGSYDLTIKIWDLTTLTTKIILTGHTEQVFSFCWASYSPYCATVCKDGKVRIYNPRKSEKPIKEGKGPEGSRGARLVWALEDRFIVVMGFDKVSERQITVYKANDLTQMNTVGLDVSPAILIPFYDEDSSTLFLTGKGDLTIYTFEITDEQPYICPLSHHKSNSLHQGLSFLPKKSCDVANVEFAKALRLTNNTIEPLSFTVPRIRSELFQDDLFPPTRVSWEPLYTSAEWFEGKEKKVVRVSLKPDDMESLSENQPQKTGGINKSQSTPFISNKDATNKVVWNAEHAKNKQDEIQKTMSNKLEINMKLEQDDMEGVDEKEWID